MNLHWLQTASASNDPMIGAYEYRHETGGTATYSISTWLEEYCSLSSKNGDYYYLPENWIFA